MAGSAESVADRLGRYADELVAAGFEVWRTRRGANDAGWLTYRNPANGCWGTLQGGSDGWEHLMPIRPSRENGSSMFVQDRRHPLRRLDPFTVEAAIQCARPSNWNEVVGRQENAPAYLSPSAVRVGDDAANGGDVS